MKEIDITGVKVVDITGSNSFYVDVELFCDTASFSKSITWLKLQCGMTAGEKKGGITVQAR